MSKKKKKKSNNVISLTEVSARLRGFLIDSQVQNGYEMSLLLGCTPLSEELLDMENEESDKRLDKIAHLIPLLFAQSHALAEGTVEYQKLNNKEDLFEVSEEDHNKYRKMLEQITMSALVGAVSQLVDMGLLKIQKRKKDE